VACAVEATPMASTGILAPLQGAVIAGPATVTFARQVGLTLAMAGAVCWATASRAVGGFEAKIAGAGAIVAVAMA